MQICLMQVLNQFVIAAIALNAISSAFGSALDNNNLIIYSFFKIQAALKLFTFGVDTGYQALSNTYSHGQN